MTIENIKVYGLEESVRASKFPRAADVSQLDGFITETVQNLASCKIGTGHDNYLNGIVVQFDLTASNKFWTQMQRYHFIDFVSSQSSMTLAKKESLENRFSEYVDKRVIDICLDLQKKYLETASEEDFMKLIYSIPSGLELTARITTNYRQLKTIYVQRKNHRLKEWRDFCKWIEGLPHSEFITQN